MILRRIFENKGAGFYVDVGAHHPKRFSNTQYFYQCGWRGINIEPNPDAVQAFRRMRERDINVQCGIADVTGTITYYKFDDPALNTFDGEMAASRVSDTPYKLIEKIDVQVRRLDNLFEELLPKGQRIDFMSVDVEGLDLQVLRSNDWDKHRPRVVLAEALTTNLEEIEQNELVRYMRSQHYAIFAKTFNTLVFVDTVKA